MASTLTNFFDHVPRYNEHFGLRSNILGSSRIVLKNRRDHLKSRVTYLFSKFGKSDSITSVSNDAHAPSPCSGEKPQVSCSAAPISASTVPAVISPPINKAASSFYTPEKLQKKHTRPAWASVSTLVTLSTKVFNSTTNSTTVQSDTSQTSSVLEFNSNQSTPLASMESVQRESVKEFPNRGFVSSTEETQKQAKSKRHTFHIAQIGRVVRPRLVEVKNNKAPQFTLQCNDDEEESETSSLKSDASSDYDAPTYKSTIFKPDGTVFTGYAATGSEPTNYTPAVFPPVARIGPPGKKVKLSGRRYFTQRRAASSNCDFPI